MSEKQTKAEIKARAMAKLLEEAGYEVEVNVQSYEADYYSDGDVMTPARVHVHVHAKKDSVFSDSYHFGFVSWLPAKGHRASTSYTNGYVHRFAIGDKKLSLKQLRMRIGSEVDSARYARTQEA